MLPDRESLYPGKREERNGKLAELNVSRQAVIKVFVRQALDQYYLARKARKAS